MVAKLFFFMSLKSHKQDQILFLKALGKIFRDIKQLQEMSKDYTYCLNPRNILELIF